MSNLTVKGNTSGTGTVILEAPNTNSNRTITLPDATATLATTAQVDAIASVTLLGTIATTSGSSVTLSGLTLTDYKFLQFFIDGVSGTTAGSSFIQLNGALLAVATSTSAADSNRGGGVIDLLSGIFWCCSLNSQGTFGNAQGGASGLTTASTSITFTISAGTFDAGSIRIYGVK